MDISNITSQISATKPSASPRKASQLGQQEFLQLLVAQMQHQDPINPMDGSEFASQLAQFNSVEQLINVNGGLESLQSSQDLMSSSLTNSMAAGLTGKQVRALSNQVYLAPGEGADVNFKLNGSAENVEIVVRNAGGSEVRRESLQSLSSGNHEWSWDGRNSNGDRMPDGTYSIEIQASNENGDVGSLLYVEGIANKVRYTGQGVMLMVNNIEVPIGDVEEVGIDIF